MENGQDEPNAYERIKALEEENRVLKSEMNAALKEKEAAKCQGKYAIPEDVDEQMTA